MSIPPSPLGALGLLPPEIRTMVYACVFAGGCTALARTSKALYAETSVALHRYGVYRVHIDSDSEDRQDPNPVVHKCPKDVQNVDIRITPSTDHPCKWFKLSEDSRRVIHLDGPLKVLEGLVDAIDKRRFCRVQFTTAPITAFFWKTLKGITWLRDFECVVVDLASYRKEKRRVLGACSAAQALHITKLELGRKEKEEGRPKVMVVYEHKDVDTGSYVCNRVPLIDWNTLDKESCCDGYLISRFHVSMKGRDLSKE